MNLRRHLESVHAVACIRRVTESGSHACIALVILHKFFERIFFACIALDAFHDAFAADGAVIGDVVVHTAVLLAAEHTTAVHVSTLEDVDKAVVLIIEDKMAPRHFVHLTRQREVVVPSQSFGCVEFIYMSAAGASTEVNKGVVVDILIT